MLQQLLVLWFTVEPLLNRWMNKVNFSGLTILADKAHTTVQGVDVIFSFSQLSVSILDLNSGAKLVHS